MGLLQVLNLPVQPGQGPLPAATVVTLAIGKPGPFEPGKEQHLAVMAMFSDGSARAYSGKATWSSSNEALLAVLPGGIARSLKAGQVTITAAAPGGKPRDSILVNVRPQLRDIEITPADPLVEVGQTEALVATAIYIDGSTEDVSATVTWGSEKPEVAEIVSIAGDCIARAKGTTRVWATTADGDVTGFTKLTVFAAGKGPKLTALRITPLSPDLKTGAPLRFKAVGTFADKSQHEITNKVAWESSDPAVLAIDSGTGLASPRLQWGKSEVQAVDRDSGLYDSTTATVQTPGITSLAVEPRTVRVVKGTAASVTLTATLRGGYEVQANDLVQWTPEDPAVADMRSNGYVVYGAAEGKTTIEAFDSSAGQSGASVLLEVFVSPPELSAIVLVPMSAQTLRVGESMPCVAIGQMSDGSTQDLVAPRWTATPPGFINVDPSGIAVARKIGKAVVRVEDRPTKIWREVEIEVLP